MDKLLLWATALIDVGIGVFFLVAPVRAAASVGITLANDTARTDVMATYGGMVLGAGLLIGLCATRPAWTAPGLWAVLFTIGGLALGRIIAIVGGARPEPLIYGFLALEILFSVVAAVLLAR